MDPVLEKHFHVKALPRLCPGGGADSRRAIKRLIKHVPVWGYTWEAYESHVKSLVTSLGLLEEQVRPADTCLKEICKGAADGLTLLLPADAALDR